MSDFLNFLFKLPIFLERLSRPGHAGKAAQPGVPGGEEGAGAGAAGGGALEPAGAAGHWPPSVCWF